MRRIGIIFTLLVIGMSLLNAAPALAQGGDPLGYTVDPCAGLFHDFWSEGTDYSDLGPPYSVYINDDGLTVVTGPLFDSIFAPLFFELFYQDDAPLFHEDGRLNYRVCRAPLAVFMNEDGGVEVWSTDEANQYQAEELKVAATAEEIAAGLAEAEVEGMDVVIAGYVDGFALVAKPDGTLKAELLGAYGCDFTSDGEANAGWCLGYEPNNDFIEAGSEIPLP